MQRLSRRALLYRVLLIPAIAIFIVMWSASFYFFMLNRRITHELKDKAGKGHFASEIRRLFLDNMHRTTVTLSADNFRQCYIPPGFAHGFCVVSSIAQIEYKCTDLYDPQGELGIAWNDPALAIPWPIREPLLSIRDQRQPTLAEVADRLPAFVGSRPA